MENAAFTDHLVDGNPRIHFSKLGNGPPIVFLHGIGGNRTNWTAQQLRMSSTYTTIAWDARGYGKSDDYEGPLCFHDFAEDLERLLDFNKIEKAHMVGLSMGARILMDFYPTNKERVATLTLCDCFFSYKKALSPEKQKEFIELRQRPLLAGKPLSELAPTLIQSLVGPNCSDQAQKQLYQSILDIHVSSYLKTIEATTKFNATGSLSDISVPVQLIFGEHDKLTPPSVGAFMHSQLPNSNLNIISDSGHLSNIEQPGDFNLVMEKFIESHRVQATFK
ncbi:MAG: alpha/beta hydrolase [Rhodospirillaceae bacterium]|nr:alpha/beta hydrolase [Rhodospirillaceae bacterium]|tara:strand:+ start:1240 stop:2073 length:834 start_codon:yes stop_codon:yes gene_type:complete